MTCAQSIVATGRNVAATTTATTVQIPFDSSGGRPKYIRVSSTGAVYVEVGNADVVAVSGDLLVQPAGSVILNVAGCTYISVIALSGTCAVSIVPTEDGRWDSATPEALDVLRYYGTNAHIYLPGVGMLNGLQAANYIDSVGTQAGEVDQPVGLVQDTLGGIHASQGTTASKPILRRGAVNLQPYSNDYTTVAWTKNNIAAPTTGIADHLGGFTAQKIVANATSSNHYLSPGAGTYPAANITCTYAVIAKMSGESVLGIGIAGGTAFSATYDLLNGTTVANNVTSEIRPLGNGFYLCVMVGTPTAYANSLYITIRATQATFLGDGVSGLILSGAALFQGTYTAAQIQALGGIPVTTTAPASTALGPYWWDTSGSKSLVATFPAGNESVTVINATPTGQVTTTAQNVVGAYNINTNTNGRIIVNGALTAPDLTLLQSLANKMAGL